MKTLIIVGHPDLNHSVINTRWIEELKKYPEEFTVHSLYEAYPKGTAIEVEKEQQLIEEHGTLILQYPLYWFNCPALLKKWMDDVFTYGWAYGSKGDKMKGRKIALSISAGMRTDDFTKNGKYGYTLEDLIGPFKMSALYMHSDFKGFHCLYGAEEAVENTTLEENSKEYISFIRSL
ncbi:NAD(P)H-dependent oxidoreductase [Apibacter raozihei]|uniref:NAD(P)H-dependent oxidoreductase n=1 Tax=Apibacter TaxID=1778601 RepID=UPI000FE35686|nr:MULTISPECIES: NAD(P)H-dependent oxidoreductase [Apibacter]